MSNKTVLSRLVMGLLTVGSLARIQTAHAVQPITSIQAHFDSLADTSEDFSARGAGTGAFPTNLTYRSTFTSAQFDNLHIDAFDVNTNNFIFRQLAQRINIVRVDNGSVTGAHQILLYDQNGAIQNTTNINLASQFIADMEGILLSDVINRGVDNVFCNTANGDGNNNNIERIDYIFTDGYPAFGNLRNRGFLVMDRGGNDALYISAILSLDTNGLPASYTAPVLVALTNWGASGITLDTIVYRGYGTNRQPSADVGAQPLTGQYIQWDEFGILTNTLVYGYSLAAADTPSTANWLNVSSFPLDTTEGSTAGGLDLMSGGALVLDESLNATLGNYVWNDLDQDGIQDANEPGVTGVLVRVYDFTGTNLAGLARTDDNGFYNVFALPPAFYQIQVALPSNWVYTLQDVGPDDTIDSDVNTNTGFSGFVQLFSTQTNNNMDAGMYLPPTDLGITKTVNNSAPWSGTSIVFTITLTNAGPFSADSVEVTDLFPAGLTLSNASVSVGSFDSTSGIWTIGFVTNLGSARLVITAGVDQASAGLRLTNTAYVSGTDRPDTNTVNNTATVVVVVRSIDLGVTKTVNNSSPGVTNMITYRVVITNNGPDVATNVTLTDVLPAGVTFSNVTLSRGTYTNATGIWNIGVMSNGASASLTFTARVDATSAGLVITNTATANVTGLGDTNADNDVAYAVITVLGADVGVTKTADNYAPYPTSNVTFTIVVTNSGPDDATGLSLIERLTNGLTYVSHSTSNGSYNQSSGIWTVGTVVAGGYATLAITANVTSNTVNTLLTNTAYITTAAIADGNTANNTGTAVIAVSSLRILKSVSPVGTTFPGSNLTYTIVVTNAGSLVQTNVVVTDAVPTGTTYVAASAQITGPTFATNTVLDRFEGVAFTNNNGTTNWFAAWTELGEADGAAAGSLLVTVDGTNRVLRVSGNNRGARRQVNLGTAESATLTFLSRRAALDNSSDFVAVYASSNGGTTFVELDRMAGSGSDASYVADSYDISDYIATNTQIRFLASSTLGSADIVYYDNVQVAFTRRVTNTLAAGTPPNLASNWTLRAGESLKVTFQIQVTNPESITQIVNTAYASSDAQIFPVSSTVSNPLSASDLGLFKTVNNAAPNAGSNVIYTITLTNNGPATVNAISVTERLTNGLTYISHSASQGSYVTNTGIWSVGIVTNGRAATLTITARVSTNSQFLGTTLTNISTITAAGLADGITTNNQARATVTVGSADLAVSKTVNDNSPLIGSNITYVVTVTNRGPSAASSVQLTDLIPSGIRFSNAVPSQGTYNSTTGVWVVSNLNNGATATLTLNASVTTSVIGVFITNRAFVTSAAQPDPVSSNNTGSVVIITTSSDPLSLSKRSSANGSAPPGTTNTYTIIVTNANSFAHTGITIVDAVPTGMTYVASSTIITAPVYYAWSWYDNFQSRLYNNNHGNTNWLTQWQESENPTNAIAGNIQITFDALRGVTYTLQFQGASVANQYIRRNADMRNFTNGTYSFEYRRDSLEAGDFVLAQISSNGFNGPWSELLRMEGPADDAEYIYTNFDIRPWLSTNVAIRFITTNTAMGAGDIVWIDDVKIEASRKEYQSFVGGLPPTLLTNQDLLANDFLTITYQAVVNDPASVTQIVNTASVTSDQQVVTLFASVTDRVEFADIGVSKTVSDAIADEGVVIRFTIAATNFGPFNATGVQLTDVLPAGFTYVSNSAGQGTYVAANGIWTVGSLAISNGTTLNLYATVDIGTAGLTLTNTVTVTRVNQGDRNPTNDTASVTVRVVPAFIITDCGYNVTNSAVEITHAITSDQQVYDLLYADGITFSNGLTNVWALADRRAGSKLIDTGAVGRTAPINLPAGMLRFYRVSAQGFWEQSPRRASAQVDAFGVSQIYPGQNWVRPWGIPCNNTFRDVLAHELPAGPNSLAATRVMWFQRDPFPVPATQEVWLASGGTNQWMCSWPTSRVGQAADAWPVPYDQGFLVEIATNLPMKKLPMIFAVPTNLQVQVVPMGNKFTLASINLPESQHPSQLHLVEAGFKGGANPVLSDWLWKYDRNSQLVPDVLWFCTTNNQWRFTSPSPQYPVVPTNYFKPDDAIVIQTRKATANLNWTNRFHYTPPTRDINP